MKRSGRFGRLVKAASVAVGVVVAYGVLHVFIAYRPAPLFSHERTYKRFTVHMREEISGEITRVLDRVESLLATSALDDPDLRHDIYIFNDRRLVTYLLFRDVHFGVNLPNGVTYIVEADVVRDEARCRRTGPLDRRRRTLSESIAHEIAHALIRRHSGRRAERGLPPWVREGYCEYVAQGSAIDPTTGLALLLADEGAAVPGFAQFRNRLMIEYLINVRGLSIDDIFRDPPEFDEVRASLVAGLRKDAAGMIERLRSRRGDRPA